VERIRILLADLPRMLHDIIQSIIAEQADMSVVGTTQDRASMTGALARTHADVAIIGLRGNESEAVLEPLLRANAHLKVLAISGDNRAATLYELRPHSVALGDVSPSSLMDAIRTMTRAEVR
jgi:DNA-binding NarL/FixJ family response regulator